MDWLESYLPVIDKFPRPDWDGIHEEVAKLSPAEEPNVIWNQIAETWLNGLIYSLPDGYQLHHSENFFLVSNENDRYVGSLLAYLERTLSRILEILPGIARDEGYGRHVALVFDEQDDYYAYLSHFYEEDGVYGMSSGIFVNRGYGHFALPHHDLSYVESVVSHEMTHALVTHLPIPAWLNEGLAVNIENILTGSAPFRMDNETYARHQAFWGEDEVQQFWSGEVFGRPDEGQELSYQLAQFAVNALSQEYDEFTEFVNKAHYQDGGEKAASEVYEGSLGNLISQYFGEGEWAPNPDKWN